MKRLLALASLLVLGVSLGVTALFASSGATGAWGADPSFASSGPIPVGHLPIGVAALSAASAPSFAPARSYPTGGARDFVAIGDLNGDGKPDLATANPEANTVSVLANRGDGSFGARLDYPTGRLPESVAIGDLNGDGKPDLATANSGADTVSVLANRGDGSFEAGRDYATGLGPVSVAVGDLNGDGKPDLATARGEGSVSVLANRGDGSFRAGLDYATGSGPYSIVIGDLNGDGKPDLATANQGADTISVLANSGDGSFQVKRDYGTGRTPLTVAIGDLNGDGRPDLATSNLGADTVTVLLNRGDGSFRAKLDYKAGDRPYSVAIGDLSGDGKPDLATADTGANRGAYAVSVLVNRGDGSFRASLHYRAGDRPYSVAIGDLNGDGRPDLATANAGDNTVSVLLNRPGFCTVQDVKRQTLLAAKRMIARSNCGVGKIRRAYAKSVKKGLVISQKPKPGTVLPKRGKVNLVVSLGRRS